MGPSQESLGADDVGRPEVPDRLPVQVELVAVERPQEIADPLLAALERRKLSDVEGKLEAATSEANAAAASVASLRDGEGTM